MMAFRQYFALIVKGYYHDQTCQLTPICDFIIYQLNSSKSNIVSKEGEQQGNIQKKSSHLYQKVTECVCVCVFNIHSQQILGTSSPRDAFYLYCQALGTNTENSITKVKKLVHQSFLTIPHQRHDTPLHTG